MSGNFISDYYYLFLNREKGDKNKQTKNKP